mgnify:CR=1 FL=1
MFKYLRFLGVYAFAVATVAGLLMFGRFEALRDAVAQADGDAHHMNAPATAEEVLRAVQGF